MYSPFTSSFLGERKDETSVVSPVQTWMFLTALARASFEYFYSTWMCCTNGINEELRVYCSIGIYERWAHRSISVINEKKKRTIIAEQSRQNNEQPIKRDTILKSIGHIVPKIVLKHFGCSCFRYLSFSNEIPSHLHPGNFDLLAAAYKYRDNKQYTALRRNILYGIVCMFASSRLFFVLLGTL